MSTIHKIEYIEAEPRVKEFNRDIDTENTVWLKIQGQHLGGRAGDAQNTVYLCLSEEIIRGLIHAMVEAASGNSSTLSTEDVYTVRGKDQEGTPVYKTKRFNGEEV